MRLALGNTRNIPSSCGVIGKGTTYAIYQAWIGYRSLGRPTLAEDKSSAWCRNLR